MFRKKSLKCADDDIFVYLLITKSKIKVMITKQAILVLLFAMFGTSLFAQNKTTITWGKDAKFDINDASIVDKGLVYIDNIYYCTKKIKAVSAVLANPTLGIVKYDKSLNIVAAKNIEVKKDKKTLNVAYIGCLKDNIIYSIQTYQNDSKGLCVAFACTINPKTLEPNNDLVKVLDVAAKGNYTNLNSFSTIPFQIVESEDKSKFAIVGTDDASTGLKAVATVMNADLTKVADYSVDIKEELSIKRFDLTNAHLTNNGELMFGGIEVGKKSPVSNNTPTENRILLVNCIKKEATYSLRDLATKDKGLGSFRLGTLPNGNFVFFCFIQNKNYSEGYHYQEFNVKTGEIVKDSKYTFSIEDIKSYFDLSGFNDIKKAKEKGKPIGIGKELKVRDFYVDSENNVWVVSEYYEPFDLASNTPAIFTNINIIKISILDTKIKWTTTIPKSGNAAWGTFDIGFILNKGKDVLDFVYYETEKNFINTSPLTYLDDLDLDYQTVSTKLSKDGKVTKQLIIAPEKGREILFLASHSYIKTGQNEGVCLGLAHFGFRNDKKYQKLGFLKF